MRSTSEVIIICIMSWMGIPGLMRVGSCGRSAPEFYWYGWRFVSSSAWCVLVKGSGARVASSRVAVAFGSLRADVRTTCRCLLRVGNVLVRSSEEPLSGSIDWCGFRGSIISREWPSCTRQKSAQYRHQSADSKSRTEWKTLVSCSEVRNDNWQERGLLHFPSSHPSFEGGSALMTWSVLRCNPLLTRSWVTRVWNEQM